ncbi:MarR family winged helix-turn-helix transcriptional regulator [Dactylosporangium maewongense]
MTPQTRAELQGRAMRELSIAHQLAETRLNRALRPLGLTMTHTAVLIHLANAGPGSVGDIAAAMEVNQPAVSKTLKTLVDRGAVTMEAAPGDARRRSVALTALGGELIGQAMRAMHPDATVAFAGLDDERLRRLVDLLAEVRATLDAARR